MPRTIIVIPCYNEAARWDTNAFRRLLADPSFDLILVNDASSDKTADRMKELEAESAGRVHILVQPRNLGKAEAVRLGLVTALGSDAAFVGYADADFATPPEELHRLTRELRQAPDTVQGVLGCRVLHLGGWIRRRPMRHYLGRAFAAWASILLRLPIYDTQCGAKVFRVGPRLREALQEPFRGRWTFDVELIRRLVADQSFDFDQERTPLLEIPLLRWDDKTGSKISLLSVPGLVMEIFLLWRRVRARR